MRLHPYPTAVCRDCGRTRRIVRAKSEGKFTRYHSEGRVRSLELPANTRLVKVWFRCGHKPHLIVTSRLEELELSVDGQGHAQPWAHRRQEEGAR